jgi:DHA2 family multidrug resistance protein-like MFS transporter
MGSGLRLLPLIGGLAVGAGLADRIAARAGAKLTVAEGFVRLVAGLALGATTSLSSGTGFLSLWTPVVGLGMGDRGRARGHEMTWSSEEVSGLDG